MTSSPTTTCGSWRGSHPTGSLAAAAQALGLALTDVEGLCSNLVDAEMIERVRVQ